MQEHWQTVQYEIKNTTFEQSDSNSVYYFVDPISMLACPDCFVASGVVFRGSVCNQMINYTEMTSVDNIRTVFTAAL